MERYILKVLLDIERDLVVGEEKGKAPKTLKRITELTESLATKVNHDEERQMIDNAINNLPLSDEESSRELLSKALKDLKSAFVNVLNCCNFNDEFNSKYPFEKNFKEVVNGVIEWVDSELE